jgi:hypothetical protein
MVKGGNFDRANAAHFDAEMLRFRAPGRRGERGGWCTRGALELGRGGELGLVDLHEAAKPDVPDRCRKNPPGTMQVDARFQRHCGLSLTSCVSN